MTTLIFLLGGLVLSSCYKDKGNYDLAPVDVIQIGGPVSGPENYALQQFDLLKISPEFTFTGDESKLEYTWKIFPLNVKPDDPRVQVISNKRELEYQVKVPVGSYSVLLEIRDPQTSIMRSRTFGVVVRLKGAQGFMVLNTKDNGEQDIDVIVDNTKPEIFFGLFSANNSIKLKDATRLGMLQSAGNSSGTIYVFQKKGGFSLGSSFAFLQDARYWFFDAQPQYAGSAIYTDFFGANAYLINDGNVHIALSPVSPPAFAYKAAGNYKATKWLFMSGYVFIYDDLNHRFLKLDKRGNRMSTITPNPVEDVFDVNDIGDKECLLFDHNLQPTVAPSAANYNLLKPIAYCRDKNGKTFMYKFGFFRSLVTYCESVHEVTAPGFSTATAYVNSANNPLTFYASGNKIYVYDFTNDKAREIYTFAESDISIDRLKTNGTKLMAVANGKSANTGAVYFFDLEATGNIKNDTYASKYDGFGKVQDVEYKFNVIPFGAVLWK